MGSALKYDGTGDNRPRLELAKDAIWMFFNKLGPEDIFSMVVFHNSSRTVIQSDFVKNMKKEDVKSAIYQKFESGGTTLREGFN